MRLTCPNCGAEYEVPDDAIPDSGRDVQCSNCGHTWFEAGAAAAETAEPAEPPAPRPPRAPRPAAPAETARDRAQPDPDAPRPGRPPPDPEAPHPDPGQPAPRRRLDPAVASVLREERATSEALRRASAPEPMERQEDLPLAEPASPARRPAPAPQPRRERLPDVDDINRRLGADPAPRASDRTAEEQAALRYRQGFRYGFGIVMLIAAAATLVYVYAPRIAEAVPSLSPPLAAYTETVDGLRLSLDNSVQSLTTRLSPPDPG
ncbi:zinc-ribbon domain-containing protein [Histidinibacterium lentulum]|uniref:Thioredoxin n=1 Tax=Histidinibacterium lentulum TaxID=2480588 RepID=A0A3N2R557_9RHOB|nr:zinc-ribbon domain-containing protein [Histidinibacterium lentulum]ROU02537.1 thioredoxin [Histidinibacterium lentulum]